MYKFNQDMMGTSTGEITIHLNVNTRQHHTSCSSIREVLEHLYQTGNKYVKMQLPNVNQG